MMLKDRLRVRMCAHVRVCTHMRAHTLTWLSSMAKNLSAQFKACCYHSAMSGCQFISIYGTQSTENTLNVSEAEMFSISKQHKQQSVSGKHRCLVIKSLRALKSNHLDLCYWLSKASHSTDMMMALLHPFKRIKPDQLTTFAIFPRFRLF